MSPVLRLRRSSGAATAMVALLVSSLATPAAFPDEADTHKIGDTFSGSAIDTSVWWVGNNNPNAVAISQAEGHVTVSVSGHAPNNFDAGIATICLARGDFDARVGFELSAWPAFNGIWVSLMAHDRDWNLLGNAYRASASWGDTYGVYYPPSAGTTAPAAASGGALRLVRQGATMTGYYFAAGRWVALYSGSVPVSDVRFKLDVFNGPATPFGGDWATISLDNFFVVADAITCS
jgi:hypothetical protein